MTEIVPFPKKRKSPVVTPEMAAEIKALLKAGTMNQHDIAARYRVNQGRISEIKTGLKFPGIKPAQLDLFD
jgi:transcriptional regulator with XRE-family HTH domain